MFRPLALVAGIALFVPPAHAQEDLGDEAPMPTGNRRVVVHHRDAPEDAAAAQPPAAPKTVPVAHAIAHPAKASKKAHHARPAHRRPAKRRTKAKGHAKRRPNDSRQ